VTVSIDVRTAFLRGRRRQRAFAFAFVPVPVHDVHRAPAFSVSHLPD
jgi:hypothetical protein